MRKLAVLFPVAIVLLDPLGNRAAAAPRDAESVATGPYHSCAITSCGEVNCWGRDDWGQSADRNPTVGIVPIWAPIIPKYDDVSAGQYHTCGLDVNGKADCWGKANYGQSADRVGPFMDLDAGWNHNCAIRESDHGIECWGASAGTPTVDVFEDVSAGLDFACGVVEGGELIECWGSNTYGQAPSSIEAPNLEAGEVFLEVSAGGYHTCALADWNGATSVYCWGYEPYASMSGYGVDLGNGVFWQGYYDLVQVDAGTSGVAVIREDGNGYGYGFPFGTHPIAANTSAEDLAVGSDHWCRVDDLGNLSCAGSNGYGKTTAPSMANNCPGVFPF